MLCWLWEPVCRATNESTCGIIFSAVSSTQMEKAPLVIVGVACDFGQDSSLATVGILGLELLETLMQSHMSQSGA